MRFHGFDYLRAFGMLAVVYIHGCDTNDLASRGMKWLGFAVPCFFMMSAFLMQLSVLKKTERAFLELIQSRFKRLAPPFLIWSAIYLAFRFAKSLATGESLDVSWSGVLLWGDASHQLYFVPILMYLFIGWMLVMTLARSHGKAAALICVLGVAASLLFGSRLDQALPENRWFVAKNLVWFPMAMLMGLVVQKYQEKTRFLFWPAVISFVVMVATDIVKVHWISLNAFGLALSIQTPPPKWLSFLAKYSFGVYLVHVLLIEGMQFVAPRLGLSVDRLSVTSIIIVVSASASYAVCGFLGRFDATRWSVT